MARSLWMILISGCALLVAGCGQDSGTNPVYQERIDLIAEAAALLEGIKDEATAHAAAARAEQITECLRANRGETDRLTAAGLWKAPTQAQIVQHANVSQRYTQVLFRVPNLQGTKFTRSLTLAMQPIEIIKDRP
jgi:hypothetical protein